MNFFENTFLDWKVTLDPIAAKNPPQLKVASLAEASATPPTIGTSDPTTASVGASPRKRADSKTEKKGSMALMVCVKETATAGVGNGGMVGVGRALANAPGDACLGIRG